MKNLLNIKQDIQDLYYESLKNIKKIEKMNKKYFKKMKQKVSYIINNLDKSTSFFNTADNSVYENIFLCESLQIKITHYNSISFLKYLDVNELTKDKNFITFFRNIILTELIYQHASNKEQIHQTNYFKNMQNYYGDIRKVFLSYFLLKEKNITLNKVQNITSYIFKGANFYQSLLNIPKDKQIL